MPMIAIIIKSQLTCKNMKKYEKTYFILLCLLFCWKPAGEQQKDKLREKKLKKLSLFLFAAAATTFKNK